MECMQSITNTIVCYRFWTVIQSDNNALLEMKTNTTSLAWYSQWIEILFCAKLPLRCQSKWIHACKRTRTNSHSHTGVFQQQTVLFNRSISIYNLITKLALIVYVNCCSPSIYHYASVIFFSVPIAASVLSCSLFPSTLYRVVVKFDIQQTNNNKCIVTPHSPNTISDELFGIRKHIKSNL